LIASIARPTASVLVRTIGVSISPSSTICVEPANFPKPLSTANPAGNLVLKKISGVGKDCRRARSGLCSVHAGDVPDGDTCDVGYGILWPRLEMADGYVERSQS
jgi:hypothetical protein